MSLIELPPDHAEIADEAQESRPIDQLPREEGRLWRWLALAGASALGGSAVPSMMGYEDAAGAVTVLGSDG